jgi:hypothetical protein
MFDRYVLHFSSNNFVLKEILAAIFKLKWDINNSAIQKMP